MIAMEKLAILRILKNFKLNIINAFKLTFHEPTLVNNEVLVKQVANLLSLVKFSKQRPFEHFKLSLHETNVKFFKVSILL